MNADQTSLIERMNAIEDQLVPYGILLDGAPVWPVLRIGTGPHFIQRTLNFASPAFSPPTNSRTKAKILANGLMEWRRLKGWSKKGSLLFITEKGFQAKTTTGTVDRFAHPLMEAAAQQGLESILLIRSELPNGSFTCPDHTILLPAESALKARSMLHWMKPPASLDSIIGLEGVIEVLRSEFGTSSLSSLVNILHDFRLHLRTYRRLLSYLRPSHVFLTCWYSVENMAVAHVCHELEIPCIDLQHGVQGPAHLAYGAWSSIPASGCSSIPAYFWCWDESSAKNIREWAPLGHHTPFVGGSPWLEQKGNDIPSPPPMRNGILFSMQPLAEPIPDGLGPLIRDHLPESIWTFRLHPHSSHHAELVKAWIRTYGIEGRVSVQDPRTTSLPQAFQKTGLHVTRFSSVVIEAALSGIQSIALDSRSVAIFPDQIKSGELRYCPELNMLAQMIRESAAPIRTSSQLPALKERLASLLELTNR